MTVLGSNPILKQCSQTPQRSSPFFKSDKHFTFKINFYFRKPMFILFDQTFNNIFFYQKSENTVLKLETVQVLIKIIGYASNLRLYPVKLLYKQAF